jgi:hypothetical protein
MELIIKLSYSMNNYRLSTNSDEKKKDLIYLMKIEIK